MNFQNFDALCGQDSYVRCQGKERIDPAIVNIDTAENHVFSGGTVGWWVRSGYIVVDIDEGKEVAKNLVKAMGLKTLICETPKGLHLYFKTSEEHSQKVGMILPGGLKCDYRCANKGYVLLPFGSEGRRFNGVNEIAEMPLEFTPLQHRKDSLLNLKEGDGRNSTLFGHLMAYKNAGANDEQIESMAKIINSQVFQEPMDNTELLKIVENTKKYEASGNNNPYIIYTSKGAPSAVNYRAIVDYFVNRGDIFVLKGSCYQYRDGVYQEASSFVRSTIKEMIGVDTLITHQRIMEAYRLLTDDVRVQREPSQLNANRNLINFRNGIWDIDNKTLMPHDSKYLQTIQIPHTVPDKITPWYNTRFCDFLCDKINMRPEDIKMLMDYMAYCLTIDSGLKTFMLLFGPSNTGKSVLIRFFETMVGHENTSSLSMHQLNQRFYPAELYDKLLNSCADNSSLPLASIASLKKITGGDTIMHEKKGKEPFFFVPFAKLIFSFNQLPLQLEERSNAFYKRMRVLGMTRELYLDNDYVDDLCSSEGIEELLPHLLDRLPLYAIPTTKASDKYIEQLRQDSDSVHSFLMNRTRSGAELFAYKKDVYDEYLRYCLNDGLPAYKKHEFMRTMRDSGFEEGRHPVNREAVWKGFNLRRKKNG